MKSQVESASIRSTGDLEIKEVCVVLVPGSGASGFGCWSTEAFREKNGVAGSVCPAINAAIERGWAVVLCNPNDNIDERGRGRPGSSNPQEHLVTGLNCKDCHVTYPFFPLCSLGLGD